MIPCAISRSRPLPRSLVNVIVIVIRVIAVDGLVRVVWIITDHHVFSPGQRWTDGDLLLGPIAAAVPLRPRALIGTPLVMLAVLLPSHEPLERRRETLRAGPRSGRLLLLLLLSHRLALGVLVPHVPIANDGDRSRLLHLLLRCTPPPRWLILRAVA